MASVAFYSIGNWQFVGLLLLSIAFNYFVGVLLISRHLRSGLRFAALAVGVTGDLLVLGIFKYAGFFVANLDALFSLKLVVSIALPVGISFYTFTQIAFLVDAYRGKVAHYSMPHYILFVSYFPHLIAGPIGLLLRNLKGGDYQATHDLANYSDLAHHSPAVDQQVLSWLANREYSVDREAPTASLDRLKAQVRDFQPAR
jgi:D-alanyl-lipoteichoic acid acyltransferase DltB (MBOAT superfamily)